MVDYPHHCGEDDRLLTPIPNLIVEELAVLIPDIDKHIRSTLGIDGAHSLAHIAFAGRHELILHLLQTVGFSCRGLGIGPHVVVDEAEKLLHFKLMEVSTVGGIQRVGALCHPGQIGVNVCL